MGRHVIRRSFLSLRWGFARGCNNPSLYYTYVVSESLADYGDYVLGETDGIDPDPEMIVFVTTLTHRLLLRTGLPAQPDSRRSSVLRIPVTALQRHQP